MISLVILSLSTTFASDDVSDVLSDNEVIIDETLSADGDYVSIDVTNETFNDQIKIQATIAIDESDIVVFIIDGLSDLNQNDYLIRDILKLLIIILMKVVILMLLLMN